MKILQVMAGGKHGGAETAFVDMCIALHEAGEIIEVVTRANPIRVPRLEAAGIRVHTLPFAGKIDVFTSWRIKKIIQKFKPEIVQSWMSRGARYVPAWQESWAIPRYLHVARLGGYYKLKYFKTADYFAPITPMIQDYLVGKGIALEKTRLINNFAETENGEGLINRAQFDTPEEALLLVGLGRLHPSKAFDTLIKVAAAMPEVYVWIAGEGPQRKELEVLIEELDLQQRVKLLGWRSDRAVLLRTADICAFISRFEPFGTVLVQSWAQKTPVVCAKADGPRQFVRDGEDGLLVEIDDEEQMIAAFQRLRGDKALCARLVENGYRRYKNEFTKEKCLQAYLEYYHDALKAENITSLQ